MKKIFLLLPFTCLLFLSSCMSDDKVSNEMDGGYRLYNYATNQNLFSRDPALIAFSLNVLLETVEEQRAQSANPSSITVENVTVTIKEVDGDDTKETEHNLKGLVFGKDTAIEETSEGVWKITFKRGSYNDWHHNRDGSVTIDTKSVVLSDMADQQWDITPSYTIILSDGSNINNTFSFYNLERIADQWFVSGHNTASVANASSANWQFEYYISQEGGNRLSYDGILPARFYFYGAGHGYPIAFEAQMTYSVREDGPLQLKPNCGSMKYCGGSEIITADISSLDPSVYPANTVKVIWGESGDCGNYYQLNYNGYYVNN